MEQYKRSILLTGETLYDSKCEIISYKHASSSQISLKIWQNSPVNGTVIFLLSLFKVIQV